MKSPDEIMREKILSVIQNNIRRKFKEYKNISLPMDSDYLIMGEALADAVLEVINDLNQKA